LLSVVSPLIAHDPPAMMKLAMAESARMPPIRGAQGLAVLEHQCAQLWMRLRLRHGP
jgi:hypothetical protein